MIPILYTGPDCPACETAKAWLRSRGIEFDERAVDDPKTRRELLAITGKTTIPVLEFPSGELLIGWDACRWIRALDPDAAVIEDSAHGILFHGPEGLLT